MPVYEAAGRRSGLTKQQKKEQEAALYGLSANDMQEQFSSEDIEKMRAFIAQHDTKHKGIKEFDLNNPPKEPYTHQPFPAILYGHEGRKHIVVKNRKEEEAAIEAGYVKEAFPREAIAVEETLGAAESEEIARLDKIARQPKKK
jgi:hypothetical protein